MEWKLTKVSGKHLVTQKYKYALRKTLHPNRIWHFTYYYMLLFLSNKTSIENYLSVDQRTFATVYLPFYLLIFCVSWSWSNVSMLSSSKTLMRLDVLFFEGLKPQNFFIVLLFSMKLSYLLTAKINPDVIILSNFYKPCKS